MSKLTDRIESGRFTLIAEIGVNYYDIATQRGISTMDAAKLMCRKAKNAGIHAVKFQTYKAETLAAKKSPSYWDTHEEATKSQYELFKKFDSFGEAEYREVANYCAEIDIDFCSTAFDFESVDYLESMMDVYKISSSDLTNLPFIEYQASKSKPIIMSVGAGNRKEIEAAVETVRKVNSHPLILMHCVLEYPTPYEHANLRRIPALADAFPDAIIGYSDHCRPDDCADVVKSAYILGAHVVEKHFTLDKTLPGNDHYHAMDTEDAEKIIESVAFVEDLLGKSDLVHSANESTARVNARRSIVTACYVPIGTVIECSMLTFKRPGTGVSPSRINEVVGKVTKQDISKDTLLQMEMLCC
jgi:N-acetylneuraminate synthase